MKTRILMTAAALSALALAACNQNPATEDEAMMEAEDATALAEDDAMTSGSADGTMSGDAMSADQAGSEASGTVAMGPDGQPLSNASPGGTTGAPPIPSVEQQKEEAREMLSPAGASSGPTAPN